LRADGAFLCLVGAAAMAADAAGHFLGLGPLAGMRGSPHSIGGFEAHGLAIVIGVLLWRAASAPAPSWHGVGLVVHLLLGGSNLLFWSSFVHLDAVATGVVTTACHGLFVLAQATCLWTGPRPQRS
jgi:hypothetical protein